MFKGSRTLHQLTVAGAAGILSTILVAGGVLAGEVNCEVSVAPATVAVGDEFTVSGNFGPAEIYLIRGADAMSTEGADPAATTTDAEGFSVTFTAEAGDEGVWTVIAIIPETECGDSAPLTVTGAAAVPDTSVNQPSPLPLILAVVFLAALLATSLGMTVHARR